MLKRYFLAVLAVFVAWQVMDFILHGLILMRTYEATASLWRPMNEMKMGLMRLVGLISTGVFVGIYAAFVRPKSLAMGVKFGLLFGLGAGVSMGYGTYCIMPIPYHLALVWFLGTVVQAAIGGLLVGWIVREPTSVLPNATPERAA